MRARSLLALVALAAATAASAQNEGVDRLALERGRLVQAKAKAKEADVRAGALARDAAGERDAAARARRAEAAVAARVERAEAEIAAARARLAIVAALLARQRSDLAQREAPVARLLAALQSFARRPAIAAVAQPGTVADQVHLRAVLGSTLPIVRMRTVALRREVAETRRLRAQADLAAATLRSARRDLAMQRGTLVALAMRHADRATAMGRDALRQSDRALALGEAARDSVDRLGTIADEDETLDALARLAGPPTFDAAPAPAPAFRLPVPGRLIEGYGEVSGSGVRARGLTFAVAPAAIVRAPAAGRVVFARAFRGYGIVVILDHGAGWASVVTGLGSTTVARGRPVAPGSPLGAATRGDDPRITVELRRHDRPVDIAALVG